MKKFNFLPVEIFVTKKEWYVHGIEKDRIKN